MKVNTIKIIVAPLIFVFVLLGHFYLTDFSVFLTQRKWIDANLFKYIQDHFENRNIFLGYSYAITGAFASLCILNLITTSGGIKQSIRGVTISAGLWGGICFMSGCCGSPMLAIYITLFGSSIAGLTKPVTAGITTVSIFLSFYYVMRFNSKNLISNGNDSTDLIDSNNPFATVKTYKPPIKVWSIIRFVLMTVFRLFPNPSSLGIYKFGNPDKMSPVLVTSNYVLTLERVAHVLKNINCYLLVADCKGINVWCAAGAGHFTVQSIINGLKYSPIGKLVSHRRIILPQFCASGICRNELKEKTGWIPFFGPTYIKDIKMYLNNNYVKNRSLRSASFGLIQRIEMGIGSSLICVFGITGVMVFKLQNCEGCKACFYQCPVNAIQHSLQSEKYDKMSDFMSNICYTYR